jgi:preprotein translocase subunit SecF
VSKAPTRKRRQPGTVSGERTTALRRRVHIDFVGRARLWFIISAVLMVVSVGALALRGLNLSIDFVGGTSFTLTGVEQDVTDDELEAAAADAGAEEPRAQIIEEDGAVVGAIVQTEALEPGGETESTVEQAIVEMTAADEVSVSFVGPTWGEHISRRMLQALVVFLALAVAYISLRLEWKMSVAALVALGHDVLLAVGVYSLFQFTVSPPTIIAYLTILGYSLYDTVIVFDRVEENTEKLGGPGRRSYGQAVNTSMNDVLWRSVNTTVSSTLPVAALLFIGSQLFGAATLMDLALALFVGMLAGAYSSLFLAGPLLAIWREREPRLAELKRYAELRESGGDEEAVEDVEGDVDDGAHAPVLPEEIDEEQTDLPDEGGGHELSARERKRERQQRGSQYVRGPGKRSRRKRG